MGKEIEKAWASISKVMFGRALGRLDDYEKWLMRDVPPIIRVKSALSERMVHSPNFVYYEETKKQMIGLEESPEWGKQHLSREQAASMALVNSAKTLGKLKFYTPEIIDGENVGMEECGGIFFNSSYCYKSSSMAYDKYCAFCMWPRQSEHIFGSSFLFSCQFCISCYHSENLTRCFEVANSNSCTDCYFCHNCENVHESMFCFNAKNLRYAIGNREMGKEEYLKAKKRIIDEMAGKLEKEKALPYSIYNVACWKKKK